MTAFRYDVDIANRTAQHLGQTLIASSYTDLHTAATASTPTKISVETDFLYDKRRIYELNRNLWAYATRRSILRPISTSSRLWTPPTYSAVTTYQLGSVVVDSNGLWWQSQIATNLANTPSSNTTQWRQYFGPDYMEPFVADASTLAAPAAPTLTSTAGGSLAATTYYVVVTYTGPAGQTVASTESSLAVAASNLLKVTSPAAATGATKYYVYVGQATGEGTLQNPNGTTIGTDWTEPTTGLIFGCGPPAATITTFYAGELVDFNGTVYLSLVDSNTDIPPTPNWIAVNGTFVTLRILYPIGSGPLSVTTSLNAFRLPVGFLRQAPEDPKAGVGVWLGTMRGNTRKDWIFEGNYIVSATTGPIMLRYVANVADVGSMHPMFCEMLAVDMAFMLCDSFTQSNEKKVQLRRDAHDIAREARSVNAILIGPTDPDLDDYLRARY